MLIGCILTKIKVYFVANVRTVYNVDIIASKDF